MFVRLIPRATPQHIRCLSERGGKLLHKVFTKVFFATDIHGSERCFLKFINAARFHRADVLILGGDITGKMIVLITRNENGTYRSNFLGREVLVRSETDLRKLEKTVRDSGYYPYVTDSKKAEEMRQNAAEVHGIFTQLMYETLARWIRIAEERLKDSGVKLFITGGNDDRQDVLEALKTSEYVVNPENQVVRIDNFHEMISCGYSNPTPWNCPRDTSEEALTKLIEDMACRVQDMSRCVFNIHVPPINSQIDDAPRMDTSVTPPKPVVQGGQVVYVGAGSTAVRKAIEKYQPLLGLHGHIHESRGFSRIGRTFLINPGSEYSEGVLRGAIVNLTDDRILNYQLVSG